MKITTKICTGDTETKHDCDKFQNFGTNKQPYTQDQFESITKLNNNLLMKEVGYGGNVRSGANIGDVVPSTDGVGGQHRHIQSRRLVDVLIERGKY